MENGLEEGSEWRQEAPGEEVKEAGYAAPLVGQVGRLEEKVELGKGKGAEGEVLVSLFQGWAGALVCCPRH